MQQHEDDIARVARQTFGIARLTVWQRLVIANILDAARQPPAARQPAPGGAGAADDRGGGGRQIVLLPTGAGKSLCFLVPSLLLPGPTLVVYPLLALIADQQRRMDEARLASVTFRGGQTDAEREDCFRRIADGARLILATPEVLQSRTLRRRLALCGIAHIAIDEAHCVSEWGDSFRPAYLSLGDTIAALGAPVVTAFTATASPAVLERVSGVLFGGRVPVIRSESDRPAIRYEVINAYAKKRAAFRLALAERRPLLIFCGTRAKAEDMAHGLAAFWGRDTVRFYHAGLSKSEKSATEEWFFKSGDGALCCTCAYGMGVDKKDIRTVIHLEPPPTAEAYVQESGRAARDGGTAKAILLWSYADAARAERFAPGSRERVMADFAQARTCRRQILLDALGGEQARCSGCDVCGRNAPAPFAEDAALALRYLRRHRRQFTREAACQNMLREYNRKDRERFGMYVWEFADVREIVEQLEAQGLVRACAWPWSGRLDVAARPAGT